MARQPNHLLALAALDAAIRTHHHLHAPSIGTIGIAAAAAASWVGFPGPGEATLITAGVLAADHRLDIGSVLLAAFIGAVLGGVAGWLIGLKGGRAIVTARGPLHRHRLKVLAKGERFYERYGWLAVFFTPSWVAGIARMRWTRFIPANILSAALWALLVGLGAFLVGPTIQDFVSDLAIGGSIALGALLLAGAVGEVLRRRNRRQVEQRSG